MRENQIPSNFLEPDKGHSEPVFSFKSDVSLSAISAEVNPGATLNVEYVGTEKNGHFKISYLPKKRQQDAYARPQRLIAPKPRSEIRPTPIAAPVTTPMKSEPMFPLPVTEKVKNTGPILKKTLPKPPPKAEPPPPVEPPKLELPPAPRYAPKPVVRPAPVRRIVAENIRGRTQAPPDTEEPNKKQHVHSPPVAIREFLSADSQQKQPEVSALSKLLSSASPKPTPINSPPVAKVAPEPALPIKLDANPVALVPKTNVRAKKSTKSISKRKKSRTKLLVAGLLSIFAGAYLIFIMFSPQFVQTLPQESKVSALEKQADEEPVPQDNRISIPKLDMDVPISEGKTVAIIGKGGAWRLPDSSTPDMGGNTVIVGHRLTYTIPRSTFYYLDRLADKDEINVYWHGRRYQYSVVEEKVVPASEVSVEAPTDDSRLTLYTCTPLWSLNKRLVIIAKPV